METNGPGNTKWTLNKSEVANGQKSNIENGHIQFEDSKMSGLTKILLFVAGTVTVAGVLASVIMLGVLVKDLDSDKEGSGNNVGNTGAQVGTTSKFSLSSPTARKANPRN